MPKPFRARFAHVMIRLAFLSLALAVVAVGVVPAAVGLVLAAPDPSQTASQSLQPFASPRAAYHQLRYGVNTIGTDNGCIDRTKGLGFDWVTGWAYWSQIEPTKGNRNFGNLRQDVSNAAARGMHVLLKVREVPAWANGGAGGTKPPNSNADFGNFMEALANQVKGYGVAIEIFNEPNLAYEWGGSIDPARYTQLLQEAYRRVKAVDPNLLIIAAGMATTGGNAAGAMDDVEFIRRMYQNGAKHHFDYLGTHPYGFASAPEVSPSTTPLCFRRAEAQRQVMVDYGDSAHGMWATEFGWILDPAQVGSGCRLHESRDWQKVSPQAQANYLVRAYDYAYQNWPWMNAMFVFNLDFNIAYWYSEREQMRFYSLYNSNGSTRPAYGALAAMSKPGNAPPPPTPTPVPPTLALSKTTDAFLVEPSDGNPAPRTVKVSNTGAGSFTWQATEVVDRPWLTIGSGSGTASASAPGTFTLNVDKSSLAPGTHSAQVRVQSSGAVGSPKTINVTLYIGDVESAYVPFVSRNSQ